MESNNAIMEHGVQRLTGDTGASLVEYALLVSLIAFACVSALVYFQDETRGTLSKSSSAIATAGE